MIDARTLLAHVLITPTLGPNNPFNSSKETEVSRKSGKRCVCGVVHWFTFFLFVVRQSPIRSFMLGNRTPVRIVSEQSTSRPGCILELDAMVEAVHDWKQTQFLHVFQQQLLVGQRSIGSTPGDVGPTPEAVPETVPTSQRKSNTDILCITPTFTSLSFFFNTFSATVPNAALVAYEPDGVDAVSRRGSPRVVGL